MRGAQEKRDVDAGDARQSHRIEVREVDVDLRMHAFIPDPFLSEPKARLELLREMDGAHDPAAAEAIGRSLVDRFGPLPEPVQNLLFIFLLKHQLLDHGVLGIQLVENDRLVVRHPPEQPLGGAWLDHFSAVRLVQPGKTHLMIRRRRGGAPSAGDAVMRLLLKSLLGDDRLPMMRQAWSARKRTGRRRSR